MTDALRPYGDLPVSELGNAIKVKRASANATKGASSRVKLALPSNLESLAHEDVEKILDNDDYTRQQISELGLQTLRHIQTYASETSQRGRKAVSALCFGQ